MIFETNLTLKDFEGLNWLISKRIITLFAILVGLFFGGILFAKIPEQLPLIILLFMVVFFAAFLLGRAYISWRSKTIYNRASVSASLTLVLNDRGIVQTSDIGETELLWDDVYSVRRNHSSYFVFLNHKQAFYFQKRSFKDGQEQLFLHMLREKVATNKIKF